MSKILVNEIGTWTGTEIALVSGRFLTGTASQFKITGGTAGQALITDGSGGLTFGAAGSSFPTQTGQAGKFLTTDGTDASWAAVDALPSQAGQAGEYLQTDGTTATWEPVTHPDPTMGGDLTGTASNAQIAANAVTANEIAAGAVGSTELANDAVTVAEMADSVFLANRNMIINGAMQIAQRGGTAAGGTSNVYSPLDRWQLVQGSSFNFDVTASINSTTVNTSDGFQTALKITPNSTQTLTGSHNATIAYRIEGYDAQRLQQGGADAHTFTLSFYAKAVNKTGIYSVCCIKKDAAGAGRNQVKEFTLTTAWVRQEITFEADTTALIRNSNQGDLNFYFNMASGPDDLVAPTTAWQAGGGIAASTNQVNFMDSTSNEFHITGVQLEVGSVATPYEHKSYGQELQACERYYQTYGMGFHAFGISGDTIDSQFSFRTIMRASPSVTLLDTTPTFQQINVANRVGSGSVLVTSAQGPDGTGIVRVNGFSGVGANSVCFGNQTTPILGFSAEL